jgi:FkbM family methyltransferase
MSIVSYAQNFEDVMLWRALGKVENGFYIDIGAQHPVIDSVSKAFYDKGWRGIHVEATPAYASLLKQHRPDETVIQAAVNNSRGNITFYEIPETGISTGDAEIAQGHKARGFDVHEITVPCVTLGSVFKRAKSSEIHWLKIDVEGMELQVLRSWGKHKALPWIVVVESTLPLTQTENHQAWESCLFDRGYSHVYFDGLNRYYLSPSHPELESAFNAGPNVFDGFTLAGTASAPFCAQLNERHQQSELALQLQVAQAHQQQADASVRFDSALADISNLLHSTQEEAQKIKLEHAEEAAKHVVLERALHAEIQTVHTRSKMEQADAAQHERTLQARSAEALQQTQSQAQALLNTLSQREHAFGQQLQALQAEMRLAQEEAAQRERALQAQSAEALQHTQSQAQALLNTLSQREHAFGQQLQALQAEMRLAQEEAAQRERALQAQSAEALQWAQEQTQANLNTLAQREQAFGQQLQLLQTEMRQAQHNAAQREQALKQLSSETYRHAQEQAQSHLNALAQREQAFNQQLHALQIQMREAQVDAAQREQTVHAQYAEVLKQAQGQAQSHLNTLIQREQSFGRQLQALQNEIREAQANAIQRERVLQTQSAQALKQAQDQVQAHLNALAQREQSFGKQLHSLQMKMREAQIDATQLERALQAQSTAALKQAEDQAQAHRNTLAQRELAFSQELRSLQTEMRRALDDAAQHEQALQVQATATLKAAQDECRQLEEGWAQRQEALTVKIATLQNELQAQSRTQELWKQQHVAQLAASAIERNDLIETSTALQAKLKAEVISEQQAGLLLREALDELHEQMASTHDSLSWRVMAPLRSIARFIAIRKFSRTSAPVVPRTGSQNSTMSAEPPLIDAASARVKPENPATANGFDSIAIPSPMAQEVLSVAINPFRSESQPVKTQPEFSEPTMHTSQEATHLTSSSIASSLNELLAYHDRDFVHCAYRTLLGRAPDPEGLEYSLNRLRLGFSKIQVLSQLRLSPEGKAQGAEIPGLDNAIRQLQKEKYPLIGWLFKLHSGEESNHPRARKMRAIENQLLLLRLQNDQHFRQIGNAIAELHQLLVNQQPHYGELSKVISSTASPANVTAVRSELNSHPINRFSPRTRVLYFELKKAALGNFGRAKKCVS